MAEHRGTKHTEQLPWLQSGSENAENSWKDKLAIITRGSGIERATDYFVFARTTSEACSTSEQITIRPRYRQYLRPMDRIAFFWLNRQADCVSLKVEQGWLSRADVPNSWILDS